MNIGLHIKRALNTLGYDLKYHRPFYETIVQPLGIRTILDIGANDGHYATRMAALFPHACIHAFEPLPECYARLSACAAASPNISAHHTALGSEPGTVPMHQSTFHPSSSILAMTPLHTAIYPKSTGSTEVSVAVARLDDLAPTLAIETPLLIKMDVQGYEDRVIMGGTHTIARASVVIVESAYVPLYEGQPLFADIHTHLHNLGLVYYGAVERHYDKNGRPLYEDAAFVQPSIANTLK